MLYNAFTISDMIFRNTMKWIFVYSLISLAACSPYQGHSIHTVHPKTNDHVTLLKRLSADHGFDIWHVPEPGYPTAIHLNPLNRQLATEALENAGLKPTSLLPNLQTFIDDQREDNARMNKTSKDFFESFHDIAEMERWLEKKLVLCGTRCKKNVIGYTFEGRPLTVIKISLSGDAKRKESIWVDAGIHAREWVSPATALFLIQQLVDGNDDLEVRELLGRYDWYIMPLVNPDGYEYTWQKERLWRKNRRVYEQGCVGVDLNRNFDFKWTATRAELSCDSYLYPGPSAASELETKAQSEFILQPGSQWVAFITLHSFGQKFMLPWGYSPRKPPNYDAMMTAAEVATNAIRKAHGKTFDFGSASRILYSSSGTSRDWAAGVPRIPFVYTIEQRDDGHYGFLLPADQLREAVEETWSGIAALVHHIKDND